MLHSGNEILTQVKMEKKEKVMAARAASPPSFSGLSSGLDTCHWLAKKQKPTNHMKDQNAGIRKKKENQSKNSTSTTTRYDKFS